VAERQALLDQLSQIQADMAEVTDELKDLDGTDNDQAQEQPEESKKQPQQAGSGGADEPVLFQERSRVLSPLASDNLLTKVRQLEAAARQQQQGRLHDAKWSSALNRLMSLRAQLQTSQISRDLAAGLAATGKPNGDYTPSYDEDVGGDVSRDSSEEVPDSSEEVPDVDYADTESKDTQSLTDSQQQYWETMRERALAQLHNPPADSGYRPQQQPPVDAYDAPRPLLLRPRDNLVSTTAELRRLRQKAAQQERVPRLVTPPSVDSDLAAYKAHSRDAVDAALEAAGIVPSADTRMYSQGILDGASEPDSVDAFEREQAALSDAQRARRQRRELEIRAAQDAYLDEQQKEESNAQRAADALRAQRLAARARAQQSFDPAAWSQSIVDPSIMAESNSMARPHEEQDERIARLMSRAADYSRALRNQELVDAQADLAPRRNSLLEHLHRLKVSKAVRSGGLDAEMADKLFRLRRAFSDVSPNADDSY
jgi:hypothetical protein